MESIKKIKEARNLLDEYIKEVEEKIKKQENGI